MSVDSLVDGLSAQDRQALGELWHDAHRSELTVGAAYSVVVTELYELGAHLEVIQLAARAALEEVRHAEQCRKLAARYFGRPIERARPSAARMPSHPGADDTLRKHLHVVSISCINESLAVGYAEACLREAEDETLHAVLKAHLQDEIGHARVGWAHLATLNSEQKQQIGAFVPRLLRASLARWKSSLARVPEQGFAGHGFPPRAELLSLADQTVRELIIPGFSAVHVSLPAADSASLY